MVVVPPKAAETVPEWKSSAHITPKEDCCSMWQWLSMPPGSTRRSVASISRAARGRLRASATTRPSRTPTSQTMVSLALTTVPLRTTRSRGSMQILQACLGGMIAESAPPGRLMVAG